ncbi:MAG: PrsW family intramembrane metalloprotease [Candidatus Micrarchaeota archaeon]
MLETLNRILLAGLILFSFVGMSVSLLVLFVPGLIGGSAEDLAIGMDTDPGFTLTQYDTSLIGADSPLERNLSIHAPPLDEGDTLSLEIFSGGRSLASIDCLEDFGSYDDYSGISAFECAAPIPYDYSQKSSYRIYAILTRGGSGYSAGPASFEVEWTDYESSFMGFSLFMGVILALVYLVVMLPLAFFALRTSFNTRHREIVEGEFSLETLYNPIKGAKTLLQMFHGFLSSPYFWALEGLGIALILLYMLVAAEIWKSSTALIAFIFSGLAAFIIPSLWSLAWWYADYKEREPLRLLATLFLWGMLSALMAIGLNTVTDSLFLAFGLGAIGAFLVAPVLEELFKGTGLVLISEYHEFDSVEDGILFGFVIGMGFSFIENWIYFLDTPMGSDIISWIFLFLMRSILFSANHGLYTAIMGGLIGWMVERKSEAPASGFLLGWPIAAFFHAMHNSGSAVIALLGVGGVLLYCCFLIPVFDYGGLIVLIALFARSILRKR